MKTSHYYADFHASSWNKEVVLFGAGKNCDRMLRVLKLYDHIHIRGIVDNDINKCGRKKEEIKIFPVEWLMELDPSKIIVVITAKKNDEILEQLDGIGYSGELYAEPLFLRACDSPEVVRQRRYYENCYELYENLFGEGCAKKRTREIMENDLCVIPRMPVMITTRCTLRCRDCSNLIPRYENPRDYNASDIIRWLDKLFLNIDECILLELVGGEPFLHKELKTILEYVLGVEKIQKIEFTTNGMFVPDYEILMLMKSPKVIVHISDYGGINNFEKMVNELDTYMIHYNIYKDMKWVDTGSTDKANKDTETLAFQYLNCNMANKCRTLLNGKLFACSRAASLFEIGIAEDIEYVDIESSDELKEDIRRFLRNNCSQACDRCGYCSNAIKVIPAAVQLQGGKSDDIDKEYTTLNGELM